MLVGGKGARLHGLGGSGSLIWDRVMKREIGIQDMLLPGASWTNAIRQPFCVLLNREREKRREEPVKPDDMFGSIEEEMANLLGRPAGKPS